MADQPSSVESLATTGIHRILDHLPDPVVLVDGERNVLFANRAAATIMDVNLAGKDLALSFRHPAALAAVDACLRTGEPNSAEIALAAPVQRTLQLEAIGMDRDGSSDVRAMLVLRDITSAKSADLMRRDFVANVSHELRSPIASLMGFIETLLGPAKDDAKAQSKFLAIMQEEAGRMSRLIDDLLSLSRVEVTEHVLPDNSVQLGDILSMAKELFDVRAAERGVEVEIHLGNDLPPVPGDQDELMEVFQNLIDNAIKYGDREKPVKINAIYVDRLPDSTLPGVAVSIENQGDGIAAEHLPRLTERFYRVDLGRSRKLGGTGLGLAIVKHIVNRHRGRLTVDSTEGEGTKFTVFLPCSAVT